MEVKGNLVFADRFGKFASNHNSVLRYVNGCDVRIDTQSRPDGTPLALTIAISDPGKMDYSDDEIIRDNLSRQYVKVNYDGLKSHELPRAIDLLVGMYKVKKRLGKRVSYSAIDCGMPYTITKEEYDSPQYVF